MVLHTTQTICKLTRGQCWTERSCFLFYGTVNIWFGLLLMFNGTFSTNRLYRVIDVQRISRRVGREQHNHTIE